MTSEQIRLEALKLAIHVAINVPTVSKSDKAIANRAKVYMHLLKGELGNLEDSLKNLEQ